MLRRIPVQDADAHGVAKRLTERAMNVQDRPSCKPAFGQVCILVADALRSSLHPAFTLKVCLERLPRRARLRRSACAWAASEGDHSPAAVAHGSASSGITQLVQKPLRRHQVGSGKPLREAVVDRLQADDGLGLTALVAQQAR
jgi:hypothetical protein